jgi:hypothetical protein
MKRLMGVSNAGCVTDRLRVFEFENLKICEFENVWWRSSFSNFQIFKFSNFSQRSSPNHPKRIFHLCVFPLEDQFGGGLAHLCKICCNGGNIQEVF